MLRTADLRITTLSENTSSGRSLLGEWGLSMLLEANGHRLLLDTGASDSIIRNLDTLRVDLAGLEAIVLSHGHYDHTGGLPAVLTRAGAKELPVVAHPEMWGLKYSKSRKTGEHRYAGIPFAREELERLGASFRLTSAPTWFGEDIAASGEESMSTEFEAVASNLVLRSENGFVQDPMSDDQSLYVRTDEGLVVLLGCAHRGVVNIVRHACELMGTEQVHMVLGGTHLYGASEEQLVRTIEALKQMKVRWLGVSHCTGLKAAARLAAEFGDRFFFNNAGTVIRFPFSGPS
ncbi:MAG: MBL fold metallo-hydrolase [Spirochaetales bacterium]|nr:MBL fold metallo-hydrolase [Spirochaetales bacterium]